MEERRRTRIDGVGVCRERDRGQERPEGVEGRFERVAPLLLGGFVRGLAHAGRAPARSGVVCGEVGVEGTMRGEGRGTLPVWGRPPAAGGELVLCNDDN